MITGINESKTLTKHISFQCKCKFDGRKCNLDQWWNNDKSRCECNKRLVCEKNYVWNPSTCNCKDGKYAASIMDDWTITGDEIIESYKKAQKLSCTTKQKLFQQIVIKRNQPVKRKISIFYLHFY